MLVGPVFGDLVEGNQRAYVFVHLLAVRSVSHLRRSSQESNRRLRRQRGAVALGAKFILQVVYEDSRKTLRDEISTHQTRHTIYPYRFSQRINTNNSRSMRNFEHTKRPGVSPSAWRAVLLNWNLRSIQCQVLKGITHALE